MYPIQPGMLSFEGGELVIDTSSGTQGKHLTTRFTNFVYLSMTRWFGPWASGHQDCFACIFFVNILTLVTNLQA